MDFAVPADHRIKLKQWEKKYLDFARELKKLWNMKVTIVPIEIGAFGTITKGFLKGQDELEAGERVVTIQMTALLRTADHRVKLKENKKKNKYFDLVRKLKKYMECESDGYTNCNWFSWYSQQRINKGTEGLGSWRSSEDHQNFWIIEKNPGDLRRLAVTQTSVKGHQLTLMWKTLKE